MATVVPANEPTAVAGAAAKGEFRCTGCGYGVTVSRELPSCPMCASETWQPVAWTPFSRAARAH